MLVFVLVFGALALIYAASVMERNANEDALKTIHATGQRAALQPAPPRTLEDEWIGDLPSCPPV